MNCVVVAVARTFVAVVGATILFNTQGVIKLFAPETGLALELASLFTISHSFSVLHFSLLLGWLYFLEICLDRETIVITLNRFDRDFVLIFRRWLISRGLGLRLRTIILIEWSGDRLFVKQLLKT